MLSNEQKGEEDLNNLRCAFNITGQESAKRVVIIEELPEKRYLLVNANAVFDTLTVMSA